MLAARDVLIGLIGLIGNWYTIEKTETDPGTYIFLILKLNHRILGHPLPTPDQRNKHSYIRDPQTTK